jgi:hypothetical protein
MLTILKPVSLKMTPYPASSLRRGPWHAWPAIGLVLLLALSLSACRSQDVRDRDLDTLRADTRLLGDFEDDYGMHYSISKTTWRHLPGTVYHIEYWDTDGQFIVARNDDSNSGYPGLWTRIDWTLLENQDPFTWGYCLTVFDAVSATAAAAAVPALRETPREGCNGFPFSRMKATGLPK